jgi:nanoRNase/pAp phosphatase (c-di-AMP/oligoRNAs hydrolase)
LNPDEASASAEPFEGDPLGHLRAAIETARSQSTDSGDCLLILTHRGPDPDAIGACEGVRFLCERVFDVPAKVATAGEIHRAENLALVRVLGLEFLNYDHIDHEGYFGAILVDTQPGFGHTIVPEDIPLIAVFDHHVVPNVENGDGEPGPVIPHKDVRLGIGATATILYEYLQGSGEPMDTTTATALFCGIRYDTADLSRNASPLDEEAFYATFRMADREKITHINNPPLPRVYYSELHSALTEAKQHGPLVLCLLGKVSHPEFVAEMADFFLRMRGAAWVVVGGASENESSYVISLRTDYAFGNAYPLMERVLDDEGSFGGHGHIAGGRIAMEDIGESSIASIERAIRKRALAILGTNEDDLPPEGRPLS